jgi:flagellar biosynthesis protein FlhF
MVQAEFIGTSFKDVMEKTRKILGDDAFIVHSEETKEGIKVIATNDEKDLQNLEVNLSNKQNHDYVVTKDTLKNFKKTLEEGKSPIDVIKYVIDICEKQNLSSEFCDAWLNALSGDFKKDHFFLDDALERILPFNEQWIRKLTPTTPVILVGSPGCGKTSTLGKLLVILKSLKKNVRVVSLDTQKAGGTAQLDQYLTAFSMTLDIGETAYTYAKNDCITKDQILLVDTPGVNILSREGQEYFFKLSEKIREPLTLVLPNDLKAPLMMEIANEFKNYNVKFLIGTRFDVDHNYGGFFTTSFKCGLEPVLFSETPKLSEPMHVITPQKTLQLLTRV